MKSAAEKSECRSIKTKVKTGAKAGIQIRIGIPVSQIQLITGFKFLRRDLR